MMVMVNCFCDIVDRRKTFSLISSQDHCQRSSPSRIPDMQRAGFEPAQNLSSGLVELSCAVVIMATVNKLKYVLFLRKLQAIDLQNRTSSLVFFKNFIHTNTLILFEEYLFFLNTFLNGWLCLLYSFIEFQWLILLFSLIEIFECNC